LTVKASLIFGKRFTVFKIENYKSFSEFKFSILACTFVGILHFWALKFVGSPNLPLKVPVYRIPTLVIAAGIRRRLAKFRPHSKESGQS